MVDGCFGKGAAGMHIDTPTEMDGEAGKQLCLHRAYLEVAEGVDGTW